MLRDEILATLSYYDVLDFPLTAGEVFRYLVRREQGKPVSRESVASTLTTLCKEGVVGEREAFYFLFGREYIVPLRNERVRLAHRKWKRAKRAIALLRHIPFLEAVFVSGSLSIGNTDELSDLDVIIVVRAGHIWSVRFLTSLVLAFIRMRRTYTDTIAPDKICPNHFITDESLRIPFQSLYTAQLYANLVPVFVSRAELQEQFQMQNEWLFHYLYHWQMDEALFISRRYHFRFVQWVGEKLLFGTIGKNAERFAKKYQEQLIAKRPLAVRPGGHLIYNDRELAFHSGSSQEEIVAQYYQHLTLLGIFHTI